MQATIQPPQPIDIDQTHNCPRVRATASRLPRSGGQILLWLSLATAFVALVTIPLNTGTDQTVLGAGLASTDVVVAGSGLSAAPASVNGRTLQASESRVALRGPRGEPLHALEEPAGLGIAEDGTIWLGNRKQHGNYLLHFSAAGFLFDSRNLNYPSETSERRFAEIRDLKIHGEQMWLLGTIYSMGTRFPIVHSLFSQPEREASNDLPEAMFGRLTGLATAGDGQVLAVGNAGAMFGGSYRVELTRVIDAAGKPDTQWVDGFTVGGKLYTATLGDLPENRPKKGTVTAGTVSVPLVARRGSLEDAYILSVEADGTFYVLVGERLQSPPVIEHTVFHYGPDGPLLGRARVPLNAPYYVLSRRLALGPDGAIYVLLFQSDRVEVARVPFVPAGAPLPAQPLVTDPVPIAPPATPVADLASLAREADAIVEATYRRPAGAGGQMVMHAYDVNKWFKKPADWPSWRADGDAGRFILEVRTFQRPDAPEGTGILFLQRCPPLLDRGAHNEDYFCGVTEGYTGIFGSDAGKVDQAGINRYEGWNVDQFEVELQSILLKLPPEPTPTPTPVWDVAQLARHADVVAEVRCAAHGPWTDCTRYASAELEVVRALKGEKKPGDRISVLGDDKTTRQLLSQLQLGSDYLVFTSEGYLIGNVGLFRIAGGKVIDALLPKYRDADLGRLETAIQKVVQVPTSTPTPYKSTRTWNLAALVDHAALIAEVKVESVKSTPTPFSWWGASTIERLWKRPEDYYGGKLRLAGLDEDLNKLPLNIGAGSSYIVFMGGVRNGPKPDEGSGRFVGGTAGLFEVRDGLIVSAGIAKYKGWTVERFREELRRLLTPAYFSPP
jgi:hypothetical protein